ncbi:efflux RND transporter permease subunit [Acaryochloris sp. CCMEE 5410]|uniref:efflux RND transporter permease subunit n=1 Tax=Acaryochloris sp. CCMEE 5410 TaxID=310037 RepID=UPI000248400C|nr:efflux RND transporter permease subunit [Acaryochloris sp. CCMEE 5410]KAI9132790.1 efflux RND transporter permease subunit [Acaryochloris sp. CCMEE 5410]
MERSTLSLSTLSIRRHIGVFMLTLTIVVLGLFFLSTLQVDLLPSITYPRIGVRLEAPGISPDVAVDEITDPLEEALLATEGVVQIFSRTQEGSVNVDLYFEPGGNIDQALNDATAALNRALNDLPDTIEQPRLFKFDPSQLPVYEMALTSPGLDDSELRVFAEETLSRELGLVPGVSSAEVSGAAEEEIQINLDLNRMQAVGVSITEVLDALSARNQDISGGRILGRLTEPLTRTMGQFQSVDEIESLILNVAAPASANETAGAPLSITQQVLQGDQQVYLRDIAKVVDGAAEQRVFVNLNQTPAVKISLQKQPDANTVVVVDGVKAKLAELTQRGIIPAEMVMISTLDESIFIRNAIRNVAISGLSGMVLAALAVLLFLGSLRQTLIIVLAIPLATLTAIILMRLFGLSMNVFSLGGLALGVGIVVDNAIVMLETIVQGTQTQASQNGYSRQGQILRQAEQSSRQVESALVASTSTNLVAVLPFLMIGGFIALLFNELLLTISFAISASILIALTVVPVLASRLLMIRRSSRIGQTWLLVQFRDRFERATLSYRRGLGWILKWRWPVVVGAILILGSSSLMMLGQIPQEILPPINTGQASLVAQFPVGTTLEQNRLVMAKVEDILAEQPETAYAFITAGGSIRGTNLRENPLRGSGSITLKPNADVEAYTQQVSQAIDQLNLVDTRIRVSPGQVRGLITSNSPIRGADVDVLLQGEDPQQLSQAGRQVLGALSERVTGARFRPDNDPDQPELQISPDWERVAALGLSAQQMGETIQTAVEGSVPTQLQQGNRLIDIRVQLDPKSLQTEEQLAQLPLFTEGKQFVQLADVAKIDLGAAPIEIQRINQQPVYLVGGNLAEGARLSDALAEVESALATLTLPEGVSLLPSTAAQSNRALQQALQTLGGLAAFLVFVVMAVQYNSLIDPLVILFTVPLALSGGILGLYMTQTAIGATVIVGVVLLVGIVVNNAIIMVELANQIYVQSGQDRQAAILQAAPQRLKPILMTTMTTVLGMLPLALGIGQGSEFLQPLGIVVFAGLSLATLLTLFIIPCFYVILHNAGHSQKGPSSKIKTLPFHRLLQRLQS